MTHTDRARQRLCWRSGSRRERDIRSRNVSKVIEPELEQIRRMAATYSRAGQVWVESDGEVLIDLSWGFLHSDLACEKSSRFPLLCLIKPILALVIARLVEDGLIRFDTPVADILPKLGPARSILIEHLLSHRVNFPPQLGSPVQPYSPSKVLSELFDAADSWHSLDGTLIYSREASWTVLAAIAEAVSNEDCLDLMTDLVLKPLDLDIHLSIQRPTGGLNTYRSSGAGGLSWRRGMISEAIVSSFNPAWGGYAAVKEMGKLYTAVRGRLNGSDSDLPSRSTLMKMLRPYSSTRGPNLVASAERVTCGLGFGLNIKAFGGPSWASESSFGHFGFLMGHRVSLAMADPERDLALGLLFTDAGVRSSVGLRRLPDDVASVMGDRFGMSRRGKYP